MDLAIYLAIVLGGLAFVAYPVLVRPGRVPVLGPPTIDGRQQVLAAKEAVLAAINDLDFEYKTGKLSDDDYAELREGYRARALNIFKELDEEQPNDAARSCAACGQVNLRGGNFCESCGKPLAPEPVCDECHAPHERGDRFCGVCGNRLVAG